MASPILVPIKGVKNANQRFRFPAKKPMRTESERIQVRSLTLDNHSPSVTSMEEKGEYLVVVPTEGVDLRQLFVLASPQSIQIEVRKRENVPCDGNGPVISEVQDQRFSRELRFRHPIAKPVFLETRGPQLLIHCRVASPEEEQSWSQLLSFDTRASLGGAMHTS